MILMGIYMQLMLPVRGNASCTNQNAVGKYTNVKSSAEKYEENATLGMFCILNVACESVGYPLAC